MAVVVVGGGAAVSAASCCGDFTNEAPIRPADGQQGRRDAHPEQHPAPAGEP